MFIKLTQFVNWQDDNFRPVYVNSDQITYMFEGNFTFYKNPEPGTSTVNGPHTQRVTTISFAACLNEESDSINVIESFEEIDRLLPESN